MIARSFHFCLPVLGLLALSAIGCRTLPGSPERQGAPGRQFSNVFSTSLPASVRRVAMLPIYSPQTIGDAQRDLDTIFSSELTKMLRFEVVPISRSDLAAYAHREQIASSDIVPPEVFAAIREKSGADAVLFTDITHYRAYRPISIGVRAKLIDIRSLQPVWSIDSVLDSANSRVADAAREYGSDGSRSDRPAQSELVLQSPRRFGAFVAHQIFSTLPVRQFP